MQNEMLNVRSEYIIQVISPKLANGEKMPVFNRELMVIIPRVRLKKATSSPGRVVVSVERDAKETREKK